MFVKCDCFTLQVSQMEGNGEREVSSGLHYILASCIIYMLLWKIRLFLKIFRSLGKCLRERLSSTFIAFHHPRDELISLFLTTNEKSLNVVRRAS